MRTLFLLTALLPAFFGCSSQNDTGENTGAAEVVTEMVKDSVTENKKEDTLTEESISKNAVPVEGLTIDAGGLSFTTGGIDTMLARMKQQLYHIEKEVKYPNEEVRANAIRSMQLNMKMFEGNFCCITHNGAHCDNVNKLKNLQKQFGCNRFRKK